TARPSLHRCSPDGHQCEGSPASRRSARNPTHFAMTTMSYLWTRGIYMQRAPQRESPTIKAPIKKRQWGCRTPLRNAGDGSPIQSATSGYYAQALHRTADAPPNLSNRPTQSSGRAMELIRKRRSTVVRRIAGVSALGQLYEESKRGRLRNLSPAKVGAENVHSGAIQNLFAARTNAR
ncbi:phosphatidylinositol 3-related kinase, partial [Trypanosoma cruzi]